MGPAKRTCSSTQTVLAVSIYWQTKHEESQWLRTLVLSRGSNQKSSCSSGFMV